MFSTRETHLYVSYGYNTKTVQPLNVYIRISSPGLERWLAQQPYGGSQSLKMRTGALFWSTGRLLYT